MQKYEYGGYVKGYNHTNLLHFSEQLLGNVRLQYKKMTYDLMGYGWGHNSSRYGSQLTETYRLPQDDGSVKRFQPILRHYLFKRKTAAIFRSIQGYI